MIQLIGLVVLSRLLDPSDFGLIAMGATVTGFVSLFNDLGLSTATIQRHKIDQTSVSTLFFCNLAIGLALFAASLIVAPFATSFYRDGRVWLVIVGLAACMPITALGAQHSALMTRGMRWVPLQGIGLAAQITSLAVAIWLAAVSSMSYLALVVQALVNAIVWLVLVWIISDWVPSLTCRLAHVRSDLKFGAYLSGFTLVNYFHDQSDNALLGWKYGSQELGFYSRAYNLLSLPLNVVNNSVAQVAIPILSRLSTTSDEWNGVFLNLLAGCAIGSLGLSITLLVSAEPLIILAMGPKWGGVVSTFQCLAVASIFGSATSLCGYAFISKGKTKEYFHWALFASPIFLASYILGLPFKAVGVAVAYSISMACLAPLYLWYAALHTGFSFKRALSLLYPIVLAAGSSGVLATVITTRFDDVIEPIRLIIAATTTAGIYGAIITLMLLRLARYGELRASLESLLKQATSHRHAAREL